MRQCVAVHGIRQKHGPGGAGRETEEGREGDRPSHIIVLLTARVGYDKYIFAEKNRFLQDSQCRTLNAGLPGA